MQWVKSTYISISIANLFLLYSSTLIRFFSFIHLKLGSTAFSRPPKSPYHHHLPTAKHSTHAWETGRETNHEDILVTQAYCLSPDFSQSSLWLKSFLFLSQRHRSISWLITSYVNSFKKSLPFPILISTDSAYLNQINLKKLFSNCYQPAQNHPMFLMSLKVVLIIMRV